MVSFLSTEIVQNQYPAGVQECKFGESFYRTVIPIEEIKEQITFTIVVVLAVPDIAFNLICVCS